MVHPHSAIFQLPVISILVTGDGVRLGHSSPGEFFVQTNLKTDICCKQKEPMSAHQFFWMDLYGHKLVFRMRSVGFLLYVWMLGVQVIDIVFRWGGGRKPAPA